MGYPVAAVRGRAAKKQYTPPGSPTSWLTLTSGRVFQDAALSTPAASGDPLGGVYDRTGAGNHATAAGADRGTFRAAAFNGRSGSDMMSGFFGPSSGGGAGANFLDVNVPWDRRSITVGLSILPYYDDPLGTVLAIGGPAAVNGFNVFPWSDNTWSYYIGTGGVVGTGIARLFQPTVLVVRLSATAVTIKANGVTYTTGAVSSQTGTGIRLSGSNGGNYGHHSLREAVIYSTAIGDSDLDDLYAYLCRSSGVRNLPATAPMVVFDGMSIVAGATATAYQYGTAARVLDSLPAEWDYRVSAIPGQQTPAMTALQSSRVTPYFDAGRSRRVYAFAEATNHMALGGASAATAATAYASAASGARSAGADQVVAGLCLPRTGVSTVNAFNALILGSSGVYDQIVDHTGDAALMDLGSGVYDADHVHLLDAGHALWAGYWLPAVVAALS